MDIGIIEGLLASLLVEAAVGIVIVKTKLEGLETTLQTILLKL